MIWLIPFLLLCLFLLFRFVSPYEDTMGREAWEAREGWLDTNKKEGQEQKPLLVSDTFRSAYEGFLAFYRPFMERWRDALIRSSSLEQADRGGGGGGQRKEPTEAELVEQVRRMTASLGKPFPAPSDKGRGGEQGPLPAPKALQTVEDVERSRLMERIPSQVDAYQNALEWMNGQLLHAEKELDKALKGGTMEGFEGFEGGMCAELSQCFRENPELVGQLLDAQQEQKEERWKRNEKELLSRFEQFQQPRLRSAFELNGRLVRKAKETEAKAQSGDWIKDVRIGGGTGGEEARLSAPPGGDTLEQLRRKDPERYKALEAKNASLFSLKQLMEQINRRVG
jgi:hypothetical protein